MKYLILILRIVLGVLFIFSGIVKANDPLGLTYKMDEFFEVWNMNFMTHYTLALSIGMIAFEIIAGVAMIVGNAFKTYVTLLLFLNIFYTFLTYYALTSGKIKECGCFGDCIKISNTATFYKDVVLLAVTLFLYIFRFRVFPIFNKSAYNFYIVLASAIFAFGSQWWTLHHLPYHDCLPYKAGNNLLEKMKPAANATPAVYSSTFVYEKNGIKKEFTAENYPWQDTSWTHVETKTVLVKEATGEPEIHDFILTDSSGADVTDTVLGAKGYTFLWFLREPEKAKTDNMDKLHAIIAKCHAQGIPFYTLCSAGRDLCQTYQEAENMKDVPFLILDGTASKTAIRTNPGLMLMHDGIVVKKWSYMDYPKEVTLNGGTLDVK